MSESVVSELEKLVSALSNEDRERFNRLFSVNTCAGELRVPPAMEQWAIKQFGSLETISSQKIVRVTNLVTGEEVLFNELRNLRPAVSNCPVNLEEEMAKARENDVFRAPETSTPEDAFGRIRGKYCITASNVAKNDWLHGLVIFTDFNPLQFTKEKLIDYIDTGWEWAKRAHEANTQAKYFLFFWNCFWRAGATMLHGHAQIQLTSGRHYAKAENLRRSAQEYKKSHGSNYFDDLFLAHEVLGLAREKNGVRTLVSLTPFKYNEIIIFGETLSQSIKEASYDVLAFFRDKLKVRTFNYSVVTPPLAPTPESWSGFPVIARIIDRGELENRVADISGIDLFGANLVVNDPFKLAPKLWGQLQTLEKGFSPSP